MEIDNFSIVKSDLLKFDEEGEFYLVLILKRRKDTQGKMVEGVNEDNRLIKHYFVYDYMYLLRKEEAIKQLCKQNNARAYILPQRRSCTQVLWALHDKISETLKQGTKNTHFDHLIRSCVAGMHDVPAGHKWHKRWVIDIDWDDKETVDMATKLWFRDSYHYPQVKDGIRYPHDTDVNEELKVSNLAYYMWECLRACTLCSNILSLMPMDGWHALAFKEIYSRRQEFMPEINIDLSLNDVTLLPTPHGWHIVTPPFNREKSACEKFFGFSFDKWIKIDAMALMYTPETI